MEETIKTLYDHYKKNPFVCTDTRKIISGSVFFALKGDNFNANEFAEAALTGGASLAVIDDPGFIKGPGYLLVPDALEALQQLALYHRRQLNIPFIAVTGSNGKTTTKELIGAVLSSSYNTCATDGNLNNHIGVPLTLLKVNSTHRFAVIEMGANHQGEIGFLCSLAEPTHGIITNIGKAHLEGFGGLEGVKKGKGELYTYLKSNQHTVFINPDQPSLVELLGSYKLCETYGLKEGYGIYGVADSNGAFLNISWKKKSQSTSYKIKTHLTGDYNLPNLLAAVCIGDYFNVSAEKINAAIENYIPGNQRSQVLTKGSNTIVLDAYNANPTSMEAALKNFNAHYKGDKLVIIGDMLELGKDSAREHESIASLIDKMNFMEVILVGKNFSNSAGKITCHYFENAAAAKNWIRQKNFSGMNVLIKGSRGLKMEETLDGF